MPFADLKRLRRTSQALNENVIYYIKNRDRYRANNSAALQTLALTKRNFSAVYIKYITYEFFTSNWFCTHGEYITELTFTLDVHARDFKKVLEHCTALKSLCLHGNIPESNYLYDFDVICTSLEILHLSSTNNIRDFDVFVYFQVFPNIHTFSLTNNYLLSHPIVHKRYYPDSVNVVPSKDVFTYWYLTRTIEAKATQIKKLNFDETDIVKAEVDSILAIDGLKLETLHCGRRRINVNVLALSQPQLQRLTVCGATTDDLKVITSHVKDLEYLNLQKNICSSNVVSDLR